MDPFLVFDLETQRSADEVGGWGNIQSMLYSVAVVWDSEKNDFFTDIFISLHIPRIILATYCVMN